MSADLVAFLRTRLDEDEAVANAAGRGHGWHYVLSDGEFLMDLWDDAGGGLIAEAVQPRFMEHIVRYDPPRILADVAAKRAVIAALIDLHHGIWLERGSGTYDENDAPGLRDLAAPYADHEDYRSEWKP